MAKKAKAVAISKPAEKSTNVKKLSPAETKAWVEKHREGVGRVAYELIVAGKLNNAEILEEIQKRFKNAKDADGKPRKVSTTSACIAWYRSDARKAGAIA